MPKKKTKSNSDNVGYREGFHTGYYKGYKEGMRDAVIVIESILTNNNIAMKTSEFYIELTNLIEEGQIPYHDLS